MDLKGATCKKNKHQCLTSSLYPEDLAFLANLSCIQSNTMKPASSLRSRMLKRLEGLIGHMEIPSHSPSNFLEIFWMLRIKK